MTESYLPEDIDALHETIQYQYREIIKKLEEYEFLNSDVINEENAND